MQNHLVRLRYALIGQDFQPNLIIVKVVVATFIDVQVNSKIA